VSELTPKQQAFVEAYLDCLNAAEAARRAKYSEKTARQQGQRLLTNVDIAAAVKAGLAERAMPAEEVLARLAEHARGSIGAFIKAGEDGRPDGFSLAADRPLHVVKKVSVTDKGWSFEMYDAQAALVTLGKHLGLFKDTTVNLNLAAEQLAQLSDAELESLYNKLANRG
jgi:phage terminase small subunit